MLQSYHQASEQFEILFNKKKYDALPEDLRKILWYAVQASSAEMSWKAIDRYSTDYKEMAEKQGVKFYKTPDAILKRQLEMWDVVAAKKSAENPLFKKVYDSQKVFAERAGKWQFDTYCDFRAAHAHFFPAKKAKT
jgi:TRAP-type mannitol/chloroaromatic compound transport system substrate-binding protein